MPLAGQQIHQRCVHPGPLVLGTNPLSSPTPTADRDRQFCYHRPSQPGARSFLPGSACRHAARTVSSRRHHSSCSAYSLWGFWIATDGLHPSHPPEATLSIHGKRLFQEPGKSFRSAVVTESHRSHDRREPLEVVLLRG